MPIKHSKTMFQIGQDYAAFKRRVPTIVGGEAVTYFKNSFQRQGWAGQVFNKWQPRRERGGSKGRGILIKTARLMRSIRRIRTAHTPFMMAQVGSDVVYAPAHNAGALIKGPQRVRSFRRRTRGGTTTVKAHNRNQNLLIPKRQFMGNSPGLNRRLDRRFDKELNAIL